MDDHSPVLLDPIYGDGRTPEYRAPPPVAQSVDTLPDTLQPADVTRPPFSATGRLSVWRPRAPDGVFHRHGTAHFIAPDLILTAAHMVWWNEGEASGPGDFDDLSRHQIEDHVFVPGWRPDAEPGQVFRVTRIGILRGWPRWRLTPGNAVAAYKYDIAILRIDGRWDGPVTEMAALSPGDVDVRAIGYPDNYRAGRQMLSARGKLVDDPDDKVAGGTVEMAGNSMGFGASGGPWIVEREDGPRVIGVTSYPANAQGTADASPRFGEAAMGLLDAMIADRG